MTKINSELQSEMKNHPLDEFKVLITLNSRENVEKLKLTNFESLMENIFVTKMDAKNIKRLARNKNVVAIELDSEMGIF